MSKVPDRDRRKRRREDSAGSQPSHTKEKQTEKLETAETKDKTLKRSILVSLITTSVVT